MERKEFDEQLEDLSRQVDDFIKDSKKFEQAEKIYKQQLIDKDNEIIQRDNEIIKLKEKIAFLNKSIKNLEKQKIEEDKTKSFSNNNNNLTQEEISDYQKINCNLTQNSFKKKKNIRNMKNKFNGNHSNVSKNNSNKKNFVLNKHFDKTKKIDTKKLLLRSMSSTNIDQNYPLMKNKNSKLNLVSKYNNKNKGVANESISHYIHKRNESELNNISREGSTKKLNSQDSNSNVEKQLKLKLTFNINNNNNNMNKNNVMINLSTNIVNDNFNLEKMKVQQKLVEYQKLIDKKIKKLMDNKKGSNNHSKKRTKYGVDYEKLYGKNTSPKNADISKKINISSVNSEQSNNYNSNISNTIHKFVKNTLYKNIHDKNIISKKISANTNKKLINSNSLKNMRIRPNSGYRLNIVSKNSDRSAKKLLKENIIKKEEKENDNEIHEQITSKGNDEEKSEDNKK